MTDTVLERDRERLITRDRNKPREGHRVWAEGADGERESRRAAAPASKTVEVQGDGGRRAKGGTQGRAAASGTRKALTVQEPLIIPPLV